MVTLLFMLVSFNAAHASQTILESKIIKIDYGNNSNQAHLIMFEQDGQVGFLDQQNLKLLKLSEESIVKHETVKAVLDQNHQVLSLTAVKNSSLQLSTSVPLPLISTEGQPYIPTVVSSLDEASTIFDHLNRRTKRSAECYNKAEIWTYENLKQRNLKSMKVFLFFTSRYIREYNYKWWFHVSPYVLVREGGTIVEQVIDHTFTDGPTAFTPWTEIFIQTGETCPVAAKYSDYSKHEEEHDCYLMKMPMYSWQPWKLEELETKGIQKTEFLPSEIEQAYSEGFRGRRL